MEKLPYLSIQEHVQCSEHRAHHPGGKRFGIHSTTGLHKTWNLHFMYSDYKPEFFQKKSKLLCFSPACSTCEQQMPPATCLLSAPVPFIHMTFEVGK